MSFERRFTGEEDQYQEAPYCKHGPEYCGKCKPEQCLYLMPESFKEA